MSFPECIKYKIYRGTGFWVILNHSLASFNKTVSPKTFRCSAIDGIYLFKFNNENKIDVGNLFKFNSKGTVNDNNNVEVLEI